MPIEGRGRQELHTKRNKGKNYTLREIKKHLGWPFLSHHKLCTYHLNAAERLTC